MICDLIVRIITQPVLQDDVEDDVEDDQPASKRAKLEDAESAPDSNGVPDTAPEESVDGEESKS